MTPLPLSLSIDASKTMEISKAIVFLERVRDLVEKLDYVESFQVTDLIARDDLKSDLKSLILAGPHNIITTFEREPT